MKITLSFKTPDAAYYALERIDDEDERLKAEEAIKKFVEYGECVSIEIDTDTKEARVIPRR